jgi:hypothetical protein
MSGTIPPLPNTPSWRGAQLKKKHRENFTFYLTDYGHIEVNPPSMGTAKTEAGPKKVSNAVTGVSQRTEAMGGGGGGWMFFNSKTYTKRCNLHMTFKLRLTMKES